MGCTGSFPSHTWMVLVILRGDEVPGVGKGTAMLLFRLSLSRASNSLFGWPPCSRVPPLVVNPWTGLCTTILPLWLRVCACGVCIGKNPWEEFCTCNHGVLCSCRLCCPNCCLREFIVSLASWTPPAVDPPLLWKRASLWTSFSLASFNGKPRKKDTGGYIVQSCSTRQTLQTMHSTYITLHKSNIYTVVASSLSVDSNQVGQVAFQVKNVSAPPLVNDYLSKTGQQSCAEVNT